MTLERALYRRSYLFFAVFLAAMVAAFWYTYFTRVAAQPNYRMHTHGAALILWCVMLVTQPLLIRARRFAWHRRVGALSYVLVPILVFTTVDLLRYQVSRVPTLGPPQYAFVALVVNALVAFLVLYGLGIAYRRRPVVHARYMVASVFPMVTPVTDRLLYVYTPGLVPYLPTIAGEPYAPVTGFLLADALLVGLSVWDWRAHRRWNVFPLALLVLLAYHVSAMTFHRLGFWQAFCAWFVGR